MTFHSDTTFDHLTELPAGEYEHCEFNGCQLLNTDFVGYHFSDCTFRDCNLSNVDFAVSRLQTVHFQSCKMVGTRLTGAHAFGLRLSFTDCRMELADLSGLSLPETVFTGCSLTEAVLSSMDLQQAAFTDCDLALADFEGSDLRRADLGEAFNYRIKPSETRIRGAKFGRDELEGLVGELGIVVV